MAICIFIVFCDDTVTFVSPNMYIFYCISFMHLYVM